MRIEAARRVSRYGSEFRRVMGSRIIPVVSKERRYLCRRTLYIVIGELRNWEKVILVAYFVINERA